MMQKLIVRFMFSIVLLAASAEAALIHSYNFDVDASDSTGSADGALLNGASVSGGVLTLDGTNDYVQFAAGLVPSSGSWTILMRAVQPVSQIGSYVELFSQGSSLYLGHDNAGPPKVRVANWGSPGNTAFPQDTLWHDYALVSDSTAGNTKFYLDGALMGTLNTLAISPGAGDTTRLGRQHTGFAEYFGGSMDDVYVYDSALSASEVALYSLSASPVPIPGALWLFASALGMLGWMRRRRPQMMTQLCLGRN